MMKRRSSLFVMACCSAALLITSVSAQGAIVQQPLGDGWDVRFDDQFNTTFTVDTITPGFIVIQISKDFTIFGPIDIVFVQTGTDASTVPTIVINDESITNLTGIDWTDYHWELSGPAVFDTALSADWSSEPSTPFSNIVVTPGAVWADGGLVPDGVTYFPGFGPGFDDLVIDVDFSDPDPVEVTFTQFPTPEPATLALLGFGALALIRRRR